ncbi:hypothetical protein ACG7TL_002206 [Trametes sanguinea]
MLSKYGKRATWHPFILSPRLKLVLTGSLKSSKWSVSHLQGPLYAFQAFWPHIGRVGTLDGSLCVRMYIRASSELAATYAALILADDGIEITSDKILALTSAADVELEPIWASLLAKALEGKNVKDLLSNVGAGGAGPAAAAPAAGAAAGGAAAEAPKEEEKKEEKEESDDDMGFGLFD